MLNGQKVWTTNAHYSQCMIALLRTGERSADRHGGMSQFIVDLKAPGVTVRPITDLAGGRHFNEVYLDNVRLSASDGTVVLAARWHVRNPARQHCARPRLAVSTMRDIFESTFERLFSDLVTPELLRQCETGAWPAALWAALAESGFAVAAAPEDSGGAGAGWDDLCVVVRDAGRHALPLPLPEALLANALMARCGLEARNEALTVAARADLALQGSRVTGLLRDVPWGRHAAGVVALVGGVEALLLLDPHAAKVVPKQNVAGEARDDLIFDGATALELRQVGSWLACCLLPAHERGVGRHTGAIACQAVITRFDGAPCRYTSPAPFCRMPLRLQA